MIYGSVCSGIEAATMAWHPLGWKPAFFSEIEKFPRAVLQHRYPDVYLWGDFTAIRPRFLKRLGVEHAIDLLVGGTPCQSFSIAGLRKGLDDERGNLALEYLRLAKRLRPRWIVWENVPGVLSSGGGRDFGSFLGGLGQLGYGFAYRVLDAQYIRVESHARAVPQRRRRVFVVGYLGDWRRAAAVLLEPESMRRDYPPRRGSGEIAPTIPSRSTGGGGLGTDFDCDGGLQVAHSLRGEGFDASEDGTGRGTPIVAGCPPVSPAIKARDHKGPSSDGDGDGDGAPILPIAFGSKDHGADAMVGCCPTLRAGGHDGSHANAGVPPAVAISENQRAEISLKDVANALQTGGGKPGQGYPAIGFIPKAPPNSASMGEAIEQSPTVTTHRLGQGAYYEYRVRRLVPRECERLQGFTDDFTLVPYRGKPASQCSDGPRYKALGNSMAVNAMRWLGERIALVDQIEVLAA